MARAQPVAPRLWGKTEKQADGCWLWRGTIANTGYGEIYVNNRKCSTHRVAYEISKGPIPPGHVVRHTCDVRHCVNPDHLLIGLQRDNVADMHERRRSRYWGNGIAPPRGERHGAAKLTWPAVREIRRLRTVGMSGVEVARRFGVSRTTVSEIQPGKTWIEESA